MPLKLDLTRKEIPSLVIHDEDSGEKIRYEFSHILNRQERALMVKKVGKGNQTREVPDLERMFKRCIKRMGPLDPNGLPKDALESDGFCVKPEIIAQILVIPQNMGGLPEEHVEQVVRHIMGENVLGDERGNT